MSGGWRRAASPPLALILGLMLGCAGEPEPPPPPPAPPKPARAVEAAPVVSRPLAAPPPQLCPVLGKVMAAAASGFAELRGPPAGAGLDRGMTRLPGTEQCNIRSGDWPQARYRCSSRAFGSDQVAQAEFDHLAGQIDDCLTKPFWFPRAWHKGEPFEFAMGERLVTWTDRSTGPPTQLVLKVQRGLTGPDFRVLLDLGAAP